MLLSIVLHHPSQIARGIFINIIFNQAHSFFTVAYLNLCNQMLVIFFIPKVRNVLISVKFDDANSDVLQNKTAVLIIVYEKIVGAIKQ
jgi:hypothetical protein